MIKLFRWYIIVPAILLFVALSVGYVYLFAQIDPPLTPKLTNQVPLSNKGFSTLPSLIKLSDEKEYTFNGTSFVMEAGGVATTSLYAVRLKFPSGKQITVMNQTPLKTLQEIKNLYGQDEFHRMVAILGVNALSDQKFIQYNTGLTLEDINNIDDKATRKILTDIIKGKINIIKEAYQKDQIIIQRMEFDKTDDKTTLVISGPHNQGGILCIGLTEAQINDVIASVKFVEQ